MTAALVAAGSCGGGGGPTADAGFDPSDAPDHLDSADGPDTPRDPPGDPGPEPDAPTDTAQDTAGDGTPVDAVPEADGSEDTAEDRAPDASGCLPPGATFTSVEAWVICFMGTGTHAAFTLHYSNPSTTCDITGIAVTGGALHLSSDGTSLMTFGATPPTSTFGGAVAAGASATVDYHAFDSALDTRSYDGSSVYVTADVSSSTGSLTVTSASTTLTCVY
jgi:hypothetical protein